MEKSAHQQRVEEFMRAANQELPTFPTMPSSEVRLLRARLIIEEAIETVNGLGYTVMWDDEDGSVILTPGHIEPNLIEIADGCADLSVVTTGTLSACGIGDKELLEIVDQNNLEKFGPGHCIREDGKLIKPENHTPPTEQIHDLLKQAAKQ